MKMISEDLELVTRESSKVEINILPFNISLPSL
jgi:hypothetical protein